MNPEKLVPAVHHLQKRNEHIENAHATIASSIEDVKAKVGVVAQAAGIDLETLQKNQCTTSCPPASIVPLEHTPIEAIVAEAQFLFPQPVGMSDILTEAEAQEAQAHVDRSVDAFNKLHGLEAWDYALAGSCGVFAGMLDMFCVKAPVRSSTTPFDKELDGLFNGMCQKAFNAIFPPEWSEQLSKAFIIGTPDASTKTQLLTQPLEAFGPMSHRFRSLAHDPILGLFFGVRDILNNTCTMVDNGCIVSFPGKNTPTGPLSIFQALGKIMGHLASDFNAPSAKGNRGMGLPAPFMGLLSMFNIPLPEGELKRLFDEVQGLQGMYLRGYDLRHFIVTSVPLAIMEVVLRTAYAAKQAHLHKVSFVDALKETVPGNMSHRYRMITALAYGTFCGINAGKVAVTNNMMNVNYAAWMGLCWNSFHALKWSLCDRTFTLWDRVDKDTLDRLMVTVQKIEALEARAATLPVKNN